MLERFLQEQKNGRESFACVPAALASSKQAMLGLAATEVARWIASGCSPRLEGRVISFDALTLEAAEHVLVRRPQCTACGNPDPVKVGRSAPLRLTTRKKTFLADGGHRAEAPGQTFERLAHHISPITGIVGALHRIVVDDRLGERIFCYTAKHAFAHVNQDLRRLRENLGGRSGGKGKSDIQARTSALCESIERYSGVFQGNETRHSARFFDLAEDAVHPNACMLFSDRQIRVCNAVEADRPRHRWTPDSFDEDECIDWTPLWSLTHERLRYLPTAYCYYGYAERFGTDFARADSNGCAAGNTKEEAILQGFMELVERDCVALWWYNRVKKPRVELLSFDDPFFKKVLAFYAELERDVWVLDIATDLGIPAFAAISRRADSYPEEIIFGFGAHFDARLAISRALTELNQCLSGVKSETHQPESPPRDDDRSQWLRDATTENQPHLLPLETAPAGIESDYPEYECEDLRDDVMACVDIALRNDLEVLVLDQTRPDTELDVVKVVVPGLRHFWPRFGPGRLYDVPAKLGWLSRARSEEELNPVPIFF